MAKKRNKKSPPGKRITAKRVQATEARPFTLPNVPVKPDVDEDAWGDDGLTVRQRLFVDALIGPAGGVGTKAAEIAGYAAENRESLKVTASRLLSSANVQDALSRRIAARKNTAEWATAGIVDIASASFANFATIGPDGQPVIDWEKAAAAAALGQIKEYYEEGFNAPSTGPVVTKRKIKLHDRRAALETLLKLHGLLKDRVEHSGEVKFHPITLDGEKEAATSNVDGDASGQVDSGPKTPAALP